MKLENFKRVFELQRENEEFLENIKKLLKIDSEGIVPVECFWEVIAILFKENYTVQGIDWIYWYMYEKTDGNKAYNNGKEFLKTIDELWEYVEREYKVCL